MGTNGRNSHGNRGLKAFGRGLISHAPWLLAIGVTITAFLFTSHRGGDGSEAGEPVGGRQPDSVWVGSDPDAEDVVSAITDDCTLITIEYESVISLTKKLVDVRAFLPDSWIEVWASIPGTVRAGVNLTSLAESDVAVERTDGILSARITLPHAEITESFIHYGSVQTRISERYWVHTAETVADMIQQLQVVAEDSLESRAVSAGILVQAEDRAEAVVTEIVEALGISRVEICFGGTSSVSMNARERR